MTVDLELNHIMSIPVGNKRDPLKLFVLSGLHAGAMAPLGGKTRYRVGSDIAGDIVLRDADVASHHVTIELENEVIRFESHADGVLVDKRLQVPKGHLCEPRLPFSFSIGNVNMRVAQDDEKKKSFLNVSQLKRKALFPVGLVMFCTFFIMMLYIPGMAGESGGREKLISRPELFVQDVPIETVRQELSVLLDESGLSNLKVQGNNSQLIVSGELASQEKSRWNNIQVWFDRTYGASYLLRSNLTEMQAPKVIIKAVWLGEFPYFIDEQGVRRYPGDIMADGWVLEKINIQELVLAKNGRQHILRL